MTGGVAILVPVLARPANVRPLLESIEASASSPHRVLFICDPSDTAEQDAIAMVGGQMISPGGSYAAKIRAGVQATDEPVVFLGADDLRFHPGWLEACCAVMAAGAQVVGVNDGIRRRRGRRDHATHFLMTREYALQPAIDGGPGPLSEAYDHSFVDDELIATATRRGVYAYAPHAVVEHRHWMNDTAPDDDTYRRGRANFHADREMFAERSRLWAT